MAKAKNYKEHLLKQLFLENSQNLLELNDEKLSIVLLAFDKDKEVAFV